MSKNTLEYIWYDTFCIIIAIAIVSVSVTANSTASVTVITITIIIIIIIIIDKPDNSTKLYHTLSQIINNLQIETKAG